MPEASTAGPLAGRTVVVTRPERPEDEVAAAFTDTGATVLAVPVIGIGPPDDGGIALAEALAQLGSYDWVVVTSANAADRVADALRGADGLRGADALRGAHTVRVAAVGPRTAARLEALGIRVDHVPERFTGDDLAATFPTGTGRVLFPAAAGARDAVPDGLRSRGWQVDRVTAYRTVEVTPPPAAIEAAVAADAIVFASPSAVRSWIAATGGVPRPALAACIGPVTGAAAREAGFAVVEADPHTMDGVVAALVRTLGGEPDGTGR
ncbi:MAG: uroporphyrinogen-III synthase [Acidimicrobiales bacterium]|nr:uroporphyrinogen-III synthase [Acidimicrobiales bacterium]